MKKILISLILICVLITPAFAQENTTLDIIRQSAVSIFSTGGGGAGVCSGVVIGKTTILTAKHCIDTYEEVYVENVLVKLIIASANDDLALLIIEYPIANKKPTKLAKYDAYIGESIYHLGYPRITEEYYNEGLIIRQTKDHQYAEINIISGCSGGGVWNKKGELIGIVWGGLEFGNFLNSKVLAIFEPISDVYKFLEISL